MIEYDDDNFELCDQVYWKIVSYYGEELEACNLSDTYQTVLLVWHAAGIIDNGGFEYLFEGDFQGDPEYKLTCKAFERIKCVSAFHAFQDALGVFLDHSILTDTVLRQEFYKTIAEKKRDEINKKFWSVGIGGTDQIKDLLADFIRNHKLEFDDIV